MRKEIKIIMFMILLLPIIGCSSLNSYIEDKMIEKSGILEEEMYIEYQNHIESGNIDEKGYFVECFQQVQSGSIHITFSMNNNLDITYYSNRECSNEIDIMNCYLNPGMSVYANIVIGEDVYSSMYEFTSFNICEYDEEGNRAVVDKWDQIVTATDEGYFVEIKIPSDFNGKEMSIEPLGKYRLRQITLNDYYMDEADNEYPLDGTWMIDDEICTEDVAEI